MEVARRRMNVITAHFAVRDDATPAYLLPMNCSSSLNSVISRCDNRMYFARQGSASQAFFMRQSSSDNLGPPLECSASANRSCKASEAPCFSRPIKMEPKFSNFDAVLPPPEDRKLIASDEIPNYGRPYGHVTGKKPLNSVQKMLSSESTGAEFELSPRMDVAEFGCKYITTIEVPGVNVNDIRVEVNDQNLVVTGKRSTRCRRAAGCFAYHRREILQGPYQVVWPLPSNVNKDKVSADFRDGLLQVVLPKFGK